MSLLKVTNDFKCKIGVIKSLIEIYTAEYWSKDEPNGIEEQRDEARPETWKNLN